MFGSGSTSSTKDEVKKVGGLFGAPSSSGSMFGVQKDKEGSTSMFGGPSKPAQESKEGSSSSSGMFGSKPTTAAGGIFGNKPTSSSSGSSMFGAKKEDKPAENKSDNVFGNTSEKKNSSLFGGANLGPKPSGGNLFAGPGSKPPTGSNPLTAPKKVETPASSSGGLFRSKPQDDKK